MGVFLWGGYYSIEIYRGDGISAMKLLNHLGGIKRRFCFIYPLGGEVSVRCLVSKSKKSLEIKDFKGKVVKDDFFKVREFINLTPRAYLILKDSFYKSVPFDVRVDFYLNAKSDELYYLTGVMSGYQKVQAYAIMQDYKRAEDALFNLKQINALSYASYYDFFTKTGNSFFTSLEYQKDYTLLFNLKYKKTSYTFFNINSLIDALLIQKSIYPYEILIGGVKDSKSDFVVGIKRNFTFPLFTSTLLIAKSYPNRFSLLDKKYITKQDLISLNSTYKRGRNTFNILASLANNKLSFHRFFSYKVESNLQHQAHYNLFYTLSLKREGYSNYLQTYNEISLGFLYGIMDNKSKKLKGFINPSVVYNDIGGVGWGMIFGVERRVIKADELRFKIILNNSSKGFELSYIYYF